MNGRFLLLAFAARSLSKSEKNYGETKRELLAIIFAIEKFKPYLFGCKFTLFTDHRALVYLFSQRHVNPMLERWFEELLSLDFRIVHCQGILNTLPDVLSRFYDADPTEQSDPVAFSDLLVSSEPASIEQEPSEGEKKEILAKAHDRGHFGATAMFKHLVFNRINWRGLQADCQALVSKCVHCKTWISSFKSSISILAVRSHYDRLKRNEYCILRRL